MNGLEMESKNYIIIYSDAITVTRKSSSTLPNPHNTDEMWTAAHSPNSETH